MLFLIISTIFDLLKKKKILNIQIPQVFEEISLYRNTIEIFSLQDNANSVLALHGLRFFSIFIVVLGHGILVRADSLHANNIDIAYVSIFIYFLLITLRKFSFNLPKYEFRHSIEILQLQLHEMFNLNKSIKSIAH